MLNPTWLGISQIQKLKSPKNHFLVVFFSQYQRERVELGIFKQQN